MNAQAIKKLLSNHVNLDPEKVEKYIQYCFSIKPQKNPWINQRSDQQIADYYKAVVNDGLDFDGKHVTLISTGVSYDYIAYKNKMFIAYPETLIDVQLVHKNDKFSFSKESGTVKYKHDINNPFGNDELVGCYCVIKNKRGEFLNTLNMEEIAKHRKVAKTDYIWNAWFNEMVLKTVIKKACKTHFSDIFQTIETLDNEQNDIEQSLTISIETKQELEAILTVPELNSYYKANEGKNAGIIEAFTKSCADRKEKIVEELANADN